MAGRTRLTAYIGSSAILSGVVYPCVVHWTWSNDAWLADGGIFQSPMTAPTCPSTRLQDGHASTCPRPCLELTQALPLPERSDI